MMDLKNGLWQQNTRSNSNELLKYVSQKWMNFTDLWKPYQKEIAVVKPDVFHRSHKIAPNFITMTYKYCNKIIYALSIIHIWHKFLLLLSLVVRILLFPGQHQHSPDHGIIANTGEETGSPLYMVTQVVIPAAISAVAVLAALSAVGFCLHRRMQMIFSS